MNEFDDIQNNEIVKPEEQEPSIVVDDTPEPAAEETVDEATETVEEKSEEANTPSTEEKVEDGDGDKEEAAEPEVKEEEPKSEELTEEKVEEKPAEEPTEEKAEEKPEETIEEIKARIEEEKAIVAEEKAILEFEKQARVDEDQLARFENAVSDTLVKSLNDLGVDINKSIEEIRKEDPEKARRVQQLVLEAQAVHQAFIDKQAADAKARLEEIVFTRASRLLEKFGLTEDEAPIVAETFVNIISEAGLKNLDADLVAKVELAVGRAKLLAPKVVKAVEQVKEIAKDVKETVTDLMTPAPEATAEEIVAAAEAVIEQAEPPKADLSEFKEGVSNKSVAAAKAGKSLLEEMAAISNPRERVEFYKSNFKAIEEALRTEGNK